MNTLNLLNKFAAIYTLFTPPTKNTTPTEELKIFPSPLPKAENETIINKVEQVTDQSTLSKVAEKVISVICNYPIRIAIATGVTFTGVGMLATLNFPLAFAAIALGLATFGQIYYESISRGDFDKAIHAVEEDIQEIKVHNENNIEAAEEIQEKVEMAKVEIVTVVETSNKIAVVAEEVIEDLKELEEETKPIQDKIVVIIELAKKGQESAKKVDGLLDEVAVLTTQVQENAEKIAEIAVKAEADIEKVKEAEASNAQIAVVAAIAGTIAGTSVADGQDFSTRLVLGVAGGLAAPLVYHISKNYYGNEEIVENKDIEQQVNNDNVEEIENNEKSPTYDYLDNVESYVGNTLSGLFNTYLWGNNVELAEAFVEVEDFEEVEEVASVNQNRNGE